MDSVVRRTANYKPSIWNNAYIQTLNSPYLEKRFLERANQLKGKVMILLEKMGDLIEQIELIDVLQRLGIYYHFTEYIDKVLKNVYLLDGDEAGDENLHTAALRFRLLRQHGYTISPAGIFRNFTNKKGEFMTDLCNDTKGLISLYEASYLSMESETILELAQAFAAHHLRLKLKQDIDQNIAEEIRHALELPFHWKMLRLESRWFIDAYEKKQGMDPLLLEFAKLDFNIVQAMYQDELKELSSCE